MVEFQRTAKHGQSASPQAGPICKACGKVPPRKHGQPHDDWKVLRYCGPECRPFKTCQIGREELVAELAVLAGTDTWLNIADRLGSNPASLQRRLYRMGHHVWAREIQRERWAQNRVAA